MEASINYPAVAVTAIVMFTLGALWYSPALFWKKWKSLVRMTDEEVRSGKPVKIYGLTFLAFFVAAFVLAQVLRLTNPATVLEGIQTSVWIWTGFVASTMLIHNLTQRKSLALWAIDAGYQLVAFCAAGAILTLWK